MGVMFGSVDRNRLPWLLMAVVLMFASAICGLLYMDAVGKISGWIGVPGLEYEGQVPRLQWYAGLWSGLALVFPFLAALLLGLGKRAGPSHAETSHASVITGPEVSHEWTGQCYSHVSAPGSHLGACIFGFHGYVHLGCRSARKAGRACALVFRRQFPSTPSMRRPVDVKAHFHLLLSVNQSPFS